MLKRCERCSACWIDGQHYWANGNRGTDGTQSELDLAAMVCNRFGNELCINPSKDKPGGRGWQSRQDHCNALGVVMQASMKNP